MTAANRKNKLSSGEALRTGSSIVPVYVKCPHCKTELIDINVTLDSLPAIKLALKADNKKGFLWLSALVRKFGDVFY